MRMTWATAEDYISRLLPFLVRVQAGKDVDPKLQEKVDKPFRVKREKKTEARNHGR